MQVGTYRVSVTVIILFIKLALVVNSMLKLLRSSNVSVLLD